jgi:hypothetical protein
MPLDERVSAMQRMSVLTVEIAEAQEGLADDERIKFMMRRATATAGLECDTATTSPVTFSDESDEAWMPTGTNTVRATLFVEALRLAVNSDARAEVCEMIAPWVVTTEECISTDDAIFTPTVIDAIRDGEVSPMGSDGAMIGNGEVWFREDDDFAVLFLPLIPESSLSRHVVSQANISGVCSDAPTMWAWVLP